MKDKILKAIARALFVTAWADFCEEPGNEHVEPRARSGDDWMDCSPETPEDAFTYAVQFVELVEATNSVSIEQGFDHALNLIQLNLEDIYGDPNPTAEHFGHDLVMEALGTGVSWADDYPHHGMELPRIESSVWLGVGTCNECQTPDGKHTEACYHSDCDEDDAALHGCGVFPCIEVYGLSKE